MKTSSVRQSLRFMRSLLSALRATIRFILPSATAGCPPHSVPDPAGSGTLEAFEEAYNDIDRRVGLLAAHAASNDPLREALA